MEKVSLDRQQLEKLFLKDASFSGLEISRFSIDFLAQVTNMKSNQVINTHQMMDEIRYLEGLKSKT